MHTQQLTARFPTGDEMNAALADLRRSGAVCHTGAIPYDGIGPSPVLRFSVREADLCLAKAITARRRTSLVKAKGGGRAVNPSVSLTAASSPVRGAKFVVGKPACLP